MEVVFFNNNDLKTLKGDLKYVGGDFSIYKNHNLITIKDIFDIEIKGKFKFFYSDSQISLLYNYYKNDIITVPLTEWLVWFKPKWFKIYYGVDLSDLNGDFSDLYEPKVYDSILEKHPDLAKQIYTTDSLISHHNYHKVNPDDLDDLDSYEF